jgi:hypothetical protein
MAPAPSFLIAAALAFRGSRRRPGTTGGGAGSSPIAESVDWKNMSRRFPSACAHRPVGKRDGRGEAHFPDAVGNFFRGAGNSGRILAMLRTVTGGSGNRRWAGGLGGALQKVRDDISRTYLRPVKLEVQADALLQSALVFSRRGNVGDRHGRLIVSAVCTHCRQDSEADTVGDLLGDTLCFEQ